MEIISSITQEVFLRDFNPIYDTLATTRFDPRVRTVYFSKLKDFYDPNHQSVTDFTDYLAQLYLSGYEEFEETSDDVTGFKYQMLKQINGLEDFRTSMYHHDGIIFADDEEIRLTLTLQRQTRVNGQILASRDIANALEKYRCQTYRFTTHYSPTTNFSLDLDAPIFSLFDLRQADEHIGNVMPLPPVISLANHLAAVFAQG